MASIRFWALAVAAAAAASCRETPPPKPASAAGWPPQLGASYPELTLKDAAGRDFRLSSLRGKVILLEPTGMSCPVCNAYSGANDPAVGGFGGVQPQKVLSVREILEDMGGIPFDHPDLVHVQLLLFDPSMRPTTPEDASSWSRHFKTDKHPNWLVLSGGAPLAVAESQRMVPGFHVIDREFRLRLAVEGHHPRPSDHDFLVVLRELLGVPPPSEDPGPEAEG